MSHKSIKLNLPEYTYKAIYKDEKTYIFDFIRKKYVLLSDEEWVRQHLINFLKLKGYPIGLIQVEKKLIVKRLTKRIDILVYNRQLHPFLLVETKSHRNKLDEKTFFQISRYNLALKVPFLMLSNGIQHFIYKVDYKNQTYIPLEKLPAFNSSV